jgi:hypothetical protein
LDWAEPFLNELRVITSSAITTSRVQAAGRLMTSEHGPGASFVVSQHPQRKPEKEAIEQIVTAFQVDAATS